MLFACAVCGLVLCCSLCNPVEKPDVVLLPAEPPDVQPANTRRVAAVWTVGMLCILAAIFRNCRRFLGEQPTLAATRKWQTRFVLLDLLYGLCWTAILLHPAGLDV